MLKKVSVIIGILFVNISALYAENKAYTAKEIENYVLKNCTDLKTEQDAMNCANEFLENNQGATFVEDDPYYKKKYKSKVEELQKQQQKTPKKKPKIKIRDSSK